MEQSILVAMNAAKCLVYLGPVKPYSHSSIMAAAEVVEGTADSEGMDCTADSAVAAAADAAAYMAAGRRAGRHTAVVVAVDVGPGPFAQAAPSLLICPWAAPSRDRSDDSSRP